MKKPLLLVGVALALTTAAATAAKPQPTPDQQLQTALAGRVAGKPTSCINLASVTSTRIIDGKAILYRVGGRLYLNEPRSGAPSLRDDDILVTNTIGSQLCSIDTVRLVDRASQFPRGFVSLGDFVPYTVPAKDTLR
ncbi:hypothetical protein [Sphingomonas sp. DC2300-3]|uniref:hypothetical protein n=1 Tax=unclassified Sphingomonas TaxID=196159 RepID=UPI003CF4AB83